MVDQYGIYIQADSDGGDACHRTGLAATLHFLLGDKIKAREICLVIVNKLMVSPGIFVRHPHPLPDCEWQAEPRCTSRDQASRAILAFCVAGFKKAILSWLWAMAKRGFFHQNNMVAETGKWKMPDVMGIGEVTNVIRGLDLWLLYPVLLVLDLNLLISFIVRKPWDGASLVCPDIVYSYRKFPTPFSIIAYKVLTNDSQWCAEAVNNHSPGNNGCVELMDLFIELRGEI